MTVTQLQAMDTAKYAVITYAQQANTCNGSMQSGIPKKQAMAKLQTHHTVKM
jgi:hypothetical protein